MIALSSAALLGESLEKYWDISGQLRYSLPTILMSSLVVTSIWLMRFKFDKGSPVYIGIGKFWQSIVKFAMGIGLLVVPLTLTLTLMLLFGWGNLSLILATFH